MGQHVGPESPTVSDSGRRLAVWPDGSHNVGEPFVADVGGGVGNATLGDAFAP